MRANYDFFEVEVRTLRSEADDVMSLLLHHPLGTDLPAWDPGSHVDVLLPNGILRQYSLCSDPAVPDQWRLGVLREPEGRGGSAYVHEELRAGTKVQVRAPRNNFVLEPAPSYLFIAGGIGITPILPMLRAATARNVPWRLLYLGRSRTTMAFLPELADLYGPGTPASAATEVMIHADDESGMYPLDLLLTDPDTDFHLYTCGPPPLLRAIQRFTDDWADAGRFHFERFIADGPTSAPARGGEAAGSGNETEAAAETEHEEQEFVVEIADGTEVLVPAGCSVLAALEGAGLAPLNSCREGICGTCETAVVSGEIDHRDSLLSDDEQAVGDTMMICVSRCRGRRLVLDL